ncbi:hypothetical protein Kfla_3529 [Kribbella flavida DSM 17836]|uniref:Toxin-antitoxin system, toxin component n=1 Tax=Kribbella flavida (strain DSM 17836 / JCM 10339 / NBRC 14399) TaxID=479435 RepID=D2PM07_KRIFD|nr:hypothetical protein [Kribbella flavida]ADB32587.1 hypothetical protein Kfla_3529 [Kribbella flavida DSM 17836]
MTTTPPQPPQSPYQPGGYGRPQDQVGQAPYPQYTEQPGQPLYGQPQQSQPQYGQPQAPYEQAPPFGQPQAGHPGGPQYGQPQYGQPQYGAQQFGQPGPMPHGPQPGAVQCRFCGAFPAAQATVRGHVGLLVVMRFLKLEGPFCRTCGIATVREMTSKSMWQGWWGIGSAIVNPFIMLSNIGPWKTFKDLPEPAPGAPGRPMNLGKPLFQRPAVLGLLVPVMLIAVIVIANLDRASSAEAGACVQNKGTISNPNVKVVDCGSAEAEFKVLGKVSSSNSAQCEQYPGYTVAYTESRGSSGYTLCLGSK